MVNLERWWVCLRDTETLMPLRKEKKKNAQFNIPKKEQVSKDY